MPYNKVIYKDNILIDLTGDSVSRETLARGVTAHDKAGNPIVGEANFPITLQEKSITQNGEYTPDTGYDGFSKVSVNVADIPATLQEKTATPTTSQQSITPDSGYEGLSKVTVNAIPSQYIIPTGELEITENGDYDVTEKASVKVNVPIPEQTEGYQMSLSDDGTELNFVWGGTKQFTINVGEILSATQGSAVIYIALTDPTDSRDYEYTAYPSSSNDRVQLIKREGYEEVDEIEVNSDKVWIWNEGAVEAYYEINGADRTNIPRWTSQSNPTKPDAITVASGGILTIYAHAVSTSGGGGA